MGFELHHGGNSLNNVANLHIAMAIRNTTWFELLLHDGTHKCGLAPDIAPDAEGMVHAQDGRPGRCWQQARSRIGADARSRRIAAGLSAEECRFRECSACSQD